MTCSNGTTPFLIQFALDLDYYFKRQTLDSGSNADESMWLVDTLCTALEFYAESELVDKENQGELSSARGAWSYPGGNYEQVKQLKDLLYRSYRKNDIQRTYDYFHQKNEDSYHTESPMDDRSEDVLFTEAPDSWYE